jgi:hypothetical protein
VKTCPSPFTVIVDTREQRPFGFGKIADNRGRVFKVSTCRTKLDAGDYSIQGMEDDIAVERKTKADMYGTAGRGRGRFEREVERLAAMAAPAIVIQCDDGPAEDGSEADGDGEAGRKPKKRRGLKRANAAENVPPCRRASGKCPILALLDPPAESRMSPKSVVNSLFAWSVRFRIPVWLCPDRRSAELLTFRLLQHFWNWRERQRKEGRPDVR